VVDGLTVKDLEMEGCKKYICPNLNLIDLKGRELKISDKAIKRARDLADQYVKKTYQRPHYPSIKRVIPAFIYVASILEDDWKDRKTQLEVSEAFETTEGTVRKWYRDIIETLNIRKDIIDKIGYDPTNK